MTFTDKERRAWHAEKQRREMKPPSRPNATPAAICVNCQMPFGISDGVVTEEAALCDICNGE